jgi:hypothetical protein
METLRLIARDPRAMEQLMRGAGLTQGIRDFVDITAQVEALNPGTQLAPNMRIRIAPRIASTDRGYLAMTTRRAGVIGLAHGGGARVGAIADDPTNSEYIAIEIVRTDGRAEQVELYGVLDECWNLLAFGTRTDIIGSAVDAESPIEPCIRIRISGLPEGHVGAEVLATDVMMRKDGQPLSQQEEAIIRQCITESINEGQINTERICFSGTCDYGVLFDRRIRPTLRQQGLNPDDYEPASAHGNLRMVAQPGMRDVVFFIPGMPGDDHPSAGQLAEQLHFPATCILIGVQERGQTVLYMSDAIAEERVAELMRIMREGGEYEFNVRELGVGFYRIRGRTPRGELIADQNQAFVVHPETGQLVKARLVNRGLPDAHYVPRQ